MLNTYVLKYSTLSNPKIKPEVVDAIQNQLDHFSCSRSTFIQEFATRHIASYEQAGESRTYLFLEEERNRLLGFFTLGMSSVEWGKVRESQGWKAAFTKKERRAIEQSMFGKKGFIGVYTIGELVRADGVSSEELPGYIILASAIEKISAARDIAGGRFVLVDSRKKLFEHLYKPVGFIQIDERSNPNPDETEPFVVSLLVL